MIIGQGLHRQAIFQFSLYCTLHVKLIEQDHGMIRGLFRSYNNRSLKQCISKEETMQTPSRQPVVPNENSHGEPVYLLRTFGDTFTPPAFAALIYGISYLVMGLSAGAAAGASVVFMAILLTTPEGRPLDWFGLCFVTGAVGLLHLATPLAYVFGGICILFALMTLFDANTGKSHKRKFLLFGLYLLNAGLATIVYQVPIWATLGLTFMYMIFYVSIRLLPLSLLSRSSLMDPSDE